MGRTGRNRIFWKEEVLEVPASIEDLPLKLRERGPIEEMTINEIRQGITNHLFNTTELEYLVETMAMRISVFMSNKFYSY